MLRICVVLSMTDGRRMTSLGKNASGFGMDNLAYGERCPSPSSLWLTATRRGTYGAVGTSGLRGMSLEFWAWHMPACRHLCTLWCLVCLLMIL